MRREAALGFDVGTTSVKAGLLWLDEAGPMETVSFAYPTTRPRPGWVEQDAADWVTMMARCWAELEARVGPVELRSVGICSQVNTHLLVDERLSPLYPAMTWQDTRSAAEATELDARVADRRTKLWGGPFTVDASFSLSRLAWLTEHEPDLVREARWLLQPKDYCVARLTGEIVTDPISPVGLVGADDRYIEEVLALVPGAADLLPKLAAFDGLAGATQAENSVDLPAGIPVAVGTMDAWGNVFGSGLVRHGQAMQVAGTSEIIGVLSDAAVPTPGIISFPPVHGRILHAGPTQAGGAALEWAARSLGCTAEEALALADEGRRDPQSILFLPHLDGERAPYWNPDARGVFVGMTTSTEQRHLALAVLEGVAFSARQVLGACEAAAGGQADELRMSGGAARSWLWNEIKATAHGRPISVMETLNSAVLGAALMGLVAANVEADMESAAATRTRVGTIVEPDAAGQTRSDDLFGAYTETYRALEPVFSRLAAG